MSTGYVENGFIVDLSNAKKTSEIIYELSRILDIEEAKNKQICLKLGNVELNQTELTSIKALVESMDSEIEFISTSCENTKEAAKSLLINVSEIENVVEAPDFEMEAPVSAEVETALDKIFGNGNFEEVESMEVKEFYTDIYDENEEEIKVMRSEAEILPSLYIRRTIRSGQSITSEGNLIIIGDVNPGAEIIAKGDILVWGVLGGIAHAGKNGNTQSKIMALKMNPIQIRIADIFARKPDDTNRPFVQKTNSFVPEEAKIFRNTIIVNKLLDNKDN